MKPENKEARKQVIEAAAYEVLAEKGYKATSMLAIAKRASASNETLYRWYGNKQTLFGALVAQNAKEVKEELEQAIEGGAGLTETLSHVGPMLLQLVTGERAVTLNRAAVGDIHETGTLGGTIAAGGRDAIVPLFVKIFADAQKRNEFAIDDPAEAATVYTSLLLGDLQHRRVIGVLPPLSQEEIETRSGRALSVVLQLYRR